MGEIAILDRIRWRNHRFGGYHGLIDFPNGYTGSVRTGSDPKVFHITEDKPYEVAIIAEGKLCYDTPLTDDVWERCSQDDVVEILTKIQALPERREVSL